MGQGVSECRLCDAPAKLSKVIKLGQLLRCHGPWEELVQQRGGRDVWATVLPPSFLSPSVVFPRKSDRPRCASSSNAGPISNLDGRGARSRFSLASASFAGAAALQDVKRTEERANILILQTGRIAPSPNPEGFAAQEFGRRGGWRRQTKRKKQHRCSISGFPSSPCLKTGRNLDEFQAVPLPSRFPRAEVFLCVRRETVCDYFPV